MSHNQDNHDRSHSFEDSYENGNDDYDNNSRHRRSRYDDKDSSETHGRHHSRRQENGVDENNEDITHQRSRDPEKSRRHARDYSSRHSQRSSDHSNHYSSSYSNRYSQQNSDYSNENDFEETDSNEVQSFENAENIFDQENENQGNDRFGNDNLELNPNVPQQSGKGLYFGLYFFFAFLLFYAVHDLMVNKYIEGEVGISRTGVYISLFVCIFYTFCYSVYYHIAFKHLFPTGIICLILILCWQIILYFGAYEDAMGMQRTITRWNKMVIISFALLWVILYNFFYYYHLQYKNAWKQTLIFIEIFFCFYLFYAYLAMTLSHERLDRMTVYGAYNVVVFLPWLYFVPKTYRVIGFSLVLIIAVFTAKRGIIIALPLMLLSVYLVNLIYQKSISVKKTILTIFAFVLFGILLGVANEFYEGSLFERFEGESLQSGSGRRDLWTELSTSFLHDTSLSTQITGHGVASTIGVLRTASHNEWLGFLWDYGYVGFCFLLAFFVLLFYRLVTLIKRKSSYVSAYTSMLTLMFLMTLYSSLFASHNSIFIFLFLGYVEGRLPFEDEEKLNQLAQQPVNNEQRHRIHRRRHRSRSEETQSGENESKETDFYIQS